MRANRLLTSLRFSMMASLGLLPLACGKSEALPGACASPKTDPETGIVTCAEGYVYRSRGNRCESSGALANVAPDTGKPRVTTYVDCTSDASVCDAYQYGYCHEGGAPSAELSCASGCLVDSDCGDGQMCRCTGGDFGECSYDSCDSDADCGAGLHCASYPGACGYSAFACQRADDDCGECSDPQSSQACVTETDGHRACEPKGVCGRPFLVENAARVAGVVARSDWADAPLPQPRLLHLTPEERHLLSLHWTKMGQLEHASIAAFARFSLQLLSLGAPADLLDDCTRALGDETAHARLCFQLASAYAGRAIGPGPLDIDRSLAATSLVEVVELVIAEGCVGETVAALEALEAAEEAADPVIRAAYARIAVDEQRHAELAFRFVRWALQRDQEQVKACIERALRLDIAASEAALRVARPCLLALLAETTPSPAPRSSQAS
jgi:hypothetical protein